MPPRRGPAPPPGCTTGCRCGGRSPGVHPTSSTGSHVSCPARRRLDWLLHVHGRLREVRGEASDHRDGKAAALPRAHRMAPHHTAAVAWADCADGAVTVRWALSNGTLQVLLPDEEGTALIAGEAPSNPASDRLHSLIRTRYARTTTFVDGNSPLRTPRRPFRRRAPRCARYRYIGGCRGRTHRPLATCRHSPWKRSRRGAAAMTTTRGLFFWEGSGLELGRANPYGALLTAALRRYRVELTEGDYGFGRTWLEQSRSAYDVLHLNWLDRFYARFGEPREPGRGRRAVRQLHRERHLRPPARLPADMDGAQPVPARTPLSAPGPAGSTPCSRARPTTSSPTDRFAADRIEELYDPPRPVEVIPHGNYRAIFPDTVSREQARARLEIGGKPFVYLFFGNARGYKGVADLIAAYRQAAPPDSVLLLVLRENARSPGLSSRVARARRGTTEGSASSHRATFPPRSSSTSSMPPTWWCCRSRRCLPPDPRSRRSASANRSSCRGSDACRNWWPAEPACCTIPPPTARLPAPWPPPARSTSMPARRAALQRTREFDWDPIAARIAALYRGGGAGPAAPTPL